MKIIICGSMTFSKEIAEYGKKLKKIGHEIILPLNYDHYSEKSLEAEDSNESIKNKIDHHLIRSYFREILDSDGILIVNLEKNNIKNYIGGNTFLEMGFAHVLDKKIFLLNPIPKVGYQDEIIAMQPIVINGDLTKIQ